MRSLLLIAVGLFAAVANGTEVYRWVDDQGQVHYSDRPMEGAQRVEIRPQGQLGTPKVEPRRSRSAAVEETEAPFSYRSLEILSPTQEEVLWNIEGQLDVSMRLDPRLQRGHSVELLLDGEPVAGLQPGSMQARLSEVYRGVHVLKANVRDQNGQLLIESPPRTFAVQQTSILNRGGGG
jgi:hypothetical protein